MEIRFVSQNHSKAAEVQSILGNIGIHIVHAPLHIHEIQTEDIQALVRDKVLKAFTCIGRPVFIEHTGLYIDSLQGFPGGLSQVFWEKLQADTFTRLLGNLENTALTARTVIAFCDARKIYTFEGSICGNIAKSPRGQPQFEWDCVFIPEGFDKTFAELREEDPGGGISMRKIAYDKFSCFLQSEIL